MDNPDALVGAPTATRVGAQNPFITGLLCMSVGPAQYIRYRGGGQLYWFVKAPAALAHLADKALADKSPQLTLYGLFATILYYGSYFLD